MKVLEPKVQTQYQCSFCTKILVYKEKMVKHERICYYNPNRDCGEHGCNNTGKITIYPNFPSLENAEIRDCPNCEIAEKCGGKSYI